jgi:transposase
MESSRATVPVVKLAPVPEAEAKRRRRSVQERRQIVEETLVPGASVARVARAHGVNANQVFYWRTLYRRGRLGGAAAGAALLAVTISAPAVSEASAVTASSGCRIEPESGPDPERCMIAPGTIHIQLPQAQLRIEGTADAPTLRAVLEMLRG